MRSRSQKLILSNPQLAALYNELTPITVSESDFWTRYYYHFIACYEREAVTTKVTENATQVIRDGEQAPEVGSHVEVETVAEVAQLEQPPEATAEGEPQVSAPAWNLLSGLGLGLGLVSSTEAPRDFSMRTRPEWRLVICLGACSSLPPAHWFQISLANKPGPPQEIRPSRRSEEEGKDAHFVDYAEFHVPADALEVEGPRMCKIELVTNGVIMGIKVLASTTVKLPPGDVKEFSIEVTATVGGVTIDVLARQSQILGWARGTGTSTLRGLVCLKGPTVGGLKLDACRWTGEVQEGNTNSSVELSVRHGLNQWCLQAVEKSAEEIQTNPENEDRAETGACGPIYGFPEAYGVQTLVEDGGEDWEVVFCVRAKSVVKDADGSHESMCMGTARLPIRRLLSHAAR